MKKKVSQVNFLLAMSFAMLLSIGVGYIVLKSKVTKEDLDQHLLKSLSSYFKSEVINFENSELSFKNHIFYKVKNLSIDSEKLNIRVEEIEFQIPILSLFGRRRVRSRAGEVYINLKKFTRRSNEEPPVIDQELSFEAQKVILKNEFYTYSFIKPYFRNISHNDFTSFRTKLHVEGRKKFLSGVRFWGEVKFFDLLNKKISINGYLNITSGDKRLSFFNNKKLRFMSDEIETDSFFVRKKSGKNELEFKLSFSDDQMIFKDIKISHFNVKDTPVDFKELLGCGFVDLNVSGTVKYNQKINRWYPDIKLENDCLNVGLKYNRIYSWDLKSKRIDETDLVIETTSLDLNDVNEVEIFFHELNKPAIKSLAELKAKIKNKTIKGFPEAKRSFKIAAHVLNYKLGEKSMNFSFFLDFLKEKTRFIQWEGKSGHDEVFKVSSSVGKQAWELSQAESGTLKFLMPDVFSIFSLNIKGGRVLKDELSWSFLSEEGSLDLKELVKKASFDNEIAPKELVNYQNLHIFTKDYLTFDLSFLSQNKKHQLRVIKNE